MKHSHRLLIFICFLFAFALPIKSQEGYNNFPDPDDKNITASELYPKLTEKLNRMQYILVIIIVANILAISYFTINYFLTRKRKRKQMLKAMEMRNAGLIFLESMMSAHFVSNCLQTVDNFLMKNDKKSASNYLNEMIKMMRMILVASDKNKATLEKEIEICESFLRLQQLNSGNAFSFSFVIDPKIKMDEILFPSLLMQPVIENSVKHGMKRFTGKEEEFDRGWIKIKIKRKEERLTIKVEDNGLPLLPTSCTGNSYALNAIRDRISLYNQTAKNIALFDMVNNGAGGVTSTIMLGIEKIKKKKEREKELQEILEDEEFNL